jgi:hypothetical protein
VTWTNLLANKEAQKHKTSKKELDNMRALIARDLADAGIAGLSLDRRFATAYNAASKKGTALSPCSTGTHLDVGHARARASQCDGSVPALVSGIPAQRESCSAGVRG